MLRSTVGVQRDVGVAVAGAAAATWMSERGLRVEGSTEDLRVYGDFLQAGDFGVGRLYHNAGRVVRVPSEGVTMVVVVDGEVELTAGSTTARLMKGEAFTLPSTIESIAESIAPYGTLELRLSADFAARLWVRAPEALVRIPGDLAQLRVLTAPVMTTLNSDARVEDAGWPHLQNAIENLAAAVLRALDPATPDRANERGDELVQRARAVIYANSSDPLFGVMVLASLLSVSASALHAAFAEAGTTPFSEIRRARLEAADRMLRVRGPVTRAEEEQVARLAGFRSLRAWRSAQRARAAAQDMQAPAELDSVASR